MNFPRKEKIFRVEKKGYIKGTGPRSRPKSRNLDTDASDPGPNLMGWVRSSPKVPSEPAIFWRAGPVRPVGSTRVQPTQVRSLRGLTCIAAQWVQSDLIWSNPLGSGPSGPFGPVTCISGFIEGEWVYIGEVKHEYR